MTKKRDLQFLIRERMEKTGESYVPARRQLVEKATAAPEPAGSLKGWITTGKAPQDYEFTMDRAEVRGGNPIARVRARTDKPSGFGTLMQEFIPDDYRDRRVRFSGWVKTEG